MAKKNEPDTQSWTYKNEYDSSHVAEGAPQQNLMVIRTDKANPYAKKGRCYKKRIREKGRLSMTANTDHIKNVCKNVWCSVSKFFLNFIGMHKKI